jgi:hypothetical protein
MHLGACRVIMQDKIVDAHAYLGLGFVYLYGELRVCGCALDLRQLCDVAK